MSRVTRPAHLARKIIMAKKIKSISSLLDDLDRQLYEGRWRDVEATLKKTSKRLAVPETFSRFVRAEEHVDNQFQGASADLAVAEQLLTEVIDLCQPGHDAALQQLAKIKYGQLLWLRGNYARALVSLQEGVQAQATDTSLVHTCKALSEGNMYLGLCLEQVGSGRSRLTEAIGAYEDSLRLALTVLSHPNSRSAPLARHSVAFKAIKTTTERGSLLCIQLNMPGRALNLYRRVLQSREEDLLHELRQICATSLATLLLFHASPSSHATPTSTSLATSSLSAPSPTQLHEEILLISFVAKSFTDAWTVSKKDPVPSPAVIFDLLALVSADLKLFGQFVQVLEDSMRFSCLMPHIWFQFALALSSAGKTEQALAVFHECVALSPNDPLVLTTAANFAVEKAADPQLCIKWAKKASKVSTGHFLAPRVEFLLGRGYVVLADRELSSQKRGELHKQGVLHLKQAVESDPQNIDFAFQLALQYAESRALSEAHAEVQRALGLNSGHTTCLHLLVLILAAQKEYTGALKVCDFALQKQPDNFGLLECKIKLELISTTAQQAFQTCKRALRLWQSLFAEESTGLLALVMQDQRSFSDVVFPSYDRPDVGSQDPLRAVSPDVASDAGSSHFSISATQNVPNQPNLLQARIWCTVAEVFLSAGKTSDAMSCIREAQYLAPHLPFVLITHGRVLESEGQMESALNQYRNAIVLQPVNPVALTLIGQLLHSCGRFVEAERYLREATAIDQLNHEAWYWLGEVFTAQDQHELSTECFKTSLELEQTVPLQPFSAVLSSFVPAS